MKRVQHHYAVNVEWTGNTGEGTSSYRTYSRDHIISAGGGDKAAIAGSADPAFLGDPTRWNPEELLVAATSACHKLWYLHLCADAGIVVQSYTDTPEGTMVEEPEGRFTQIQLKPCVTIRAQDDAELARSLHHKAHQYCFIANSLNFPVLCEPEIKQA
ncbi:peroxiredoxin [Mangrovibacter sp. MFB070]|uniref:OsmC family protein n=1 Tax=Mangrovibacter sp. MFB070 TaxID=1224318 RepID=UPI0004D7367D|nr:OsmC family protein [Mangrovibacter sp. MFB070]KEA50916.1 peroxiredoxin [Mangrovibacter sp. MFB070]